MKVINQNSHKVNRKSYSKFKKRVIASGKAYIDAFGMICIDEIIPSYHTLKAANIRLASFPVIKDVYGKPRTQNRILNVIGDKFDYSTIEYLYMVMPRIGHYEIQHLLYNESTEPKLELIG